MQKNETLALTENVTFKTRQVPKPIRLRFALDTTQVLRVVVGVLAVDSGWETFYANMEKSGRITIPKLTRELLQAGA